jgi:protein-S-isoprenylcysteine O-methyltransferase Ste14
MRYGSKLEEFLTNPYIDKLLAVLAVIPVSRGVYTFLLQLAHGYFDLFSLGIALWGIFTIVPMLVRRTATRVSLSPFVWFITAGRTYWMFGLYYWLDTMHAVPLVPTSFIQIPFWLAIGIAVVSRVQLGRNIGFVPARRGLVTTGIYAQVRHPIHTAQMLLYVAFLLRLFTPYNALLIAVGIAFVLVKTVVEERFLREDADYREYAANVPWRYIPFVA